GMAFLTEATSSPSFADLKARIAAAYPAATWHEWEAVSRDADREGTRAAFGRPVRMQRDLTKAEVVVSLEDDFLVGHPDSLKYARDFAAGRRPDHGKMSRLYVIESAFSTTGSQADDRHALPSGGVAQVAWALAAHLVLDEHVALPAGLGGMEPLLRQAKAHGEHHPFVKKIAQDLAAHRGHGIITAGAGQPAAVHALCHALNAALGNVVATVTYTEDPAGDRPASAESLKQLVTALNGGRVQTLVVLGGNPVYDAPADLDFAAAYAKAGERVHLSLHRNETTHASTWHAPRAHYLEAWSDGLTWDGTYTLAQPLIQPLFGGKTPAAFLNFLLAGGDADDAKLVRDAYAKRFGADEKKWRQALHDGFARGTAAGAATVQMGNGNWKPQASDFDWHAPTGNNTEVVFRPDAMLHDGRFANNPWLQETPDPMSKLTWDNAALVNPITAREMGLKQGDMIRLTSGSRSVDVPTYLMTGQAKGSVALTLGYCRRAGGFIAAPENPGDEGGGFDVYPLRTADGQWTLAGAQIAKAGGSYKLVTTQDHHAINNPEQGRGQARRLPELFREGTLAEYDEHPDFAKHRTHHPPLLSLWKEHDYSQGHKWGLTIDLASCTGCSACVVACTAENNTSTVGKDEVSRGREMHWIRIDRYFSGELENPRALHQPIICMQCENAPCEQVCPVAATIHSSEGLNDMVYNRCVGTRYCSNNCPYKVRRFNWFNNTDNQYNNPPLFKMQRNPEVTVRARGVMEKCTYCVQRIKEVTIPAKNERRALRDGEIVPACAQTCPSDAIVFGDLNDPNSRVRKLQDDARSYAMLSELNIKPRTLYLARVNNPSDGGGHGHDDGHGHHAGSEAHGEGSRG
ncbi:MAG: 4Fe-4S dicluster domain-containing protein, partial [Gemmatimonadetes bacterium]|nr:4Fe-4S dicluster domain-containing protein [Gemmatimonadota bacterium]